MKLRCPAPGTVALACYALSALSVTGGLAAAVWWAL